MIRFRILHLAVGIQTDSAALREDLVRLTALLPPPAGAGVDLVYRVEQEGDGFALRTGERTWEALTRGDIFATLEGDLSRRMMQLGAPRADNDARGRGPDWALFHAAALCREGRVYLFAGCSGSGKTTLTAALLQRGFTFLSDEYAPLYLEDRTVEPCPMPLKLLQSTIARVRPGPEIELLEHGFFGKGETVRYGIPERGIVAAPGRYPLARLYWPWNRPELETQVYRPRPGVAVQQTMGATLNAPLLGERAFQLATDLVSSVPCQNLVVGDIEQACRLVCDEAT